MAIDLAQILLAGKAVLYSYTDEVDVGVTHKLTFEPDVGYIGMIIGASFKGLQPSANNISLNSTVGRTQVYADLQKDHYPPGDIIVTRGDHGAPAVVTLVNGQTDKLKYSFYFLIIPEANVPFLTGGLMA